MARMGTGMGTMIESAFNVENYIGKCLLIQSYNPHRQCFWLDEIIYARTIKDNPRLIGVVECSGIIVNCNLDNIFTDNRFSYSRHDEEFTIMDIF